MGISAKILGEDEHIVVSVRTHWKKLVGPVLVLIFTVGVAAFVAAILPENPNQQAFRIGILAVAFLIVCVWSIWPFLQWLTSTYTVTSRRLITRHGVITRTGRDIPLTRINDVSYERSLTDRMLGCGTLVIESASQSGRVVLPDVPNVERVHVQISELLFTIAGGREEDENPPAKRVDPQS
jgi:uncharacterized membrane protein YdbT with pleckstrin-like domain